jgi:hypothetical protein
MVYAFPDGPDLLAIGPPADAGSASGVIWARPLLPAVPSEGPTPHCRALGPTPPPALHREKNRGESGSHRKIGRAGKDVGFPRDTLRYHGDFDRGGRGLCRLAHIEVGHADRSQQNDEEYTKTGTSSTFLPGEGRSITNVGMRPPAFLVTPLYVRLLYGGSEGLAIGRQSISESPASRRTHGAVLGRAPGCSPVREPCALPTVHAARSLPMLRFRNYANRNGTAPRLPPDRRPKTTRKTLSRTPAPTEFLAFPGIANPTAPISALIFGHPFRAYA